MSKILSKYSKEQGLQTVEYASQKEYMDKLKNEQEAQIPSDYRVPFTYKQWLDRNIGIIPGLEQKQYSEYLKRWYENRYTSADQTDTTKEDYLNLLKDLALAFRDETTEEFIGNVDLDNEFELAESVPYFARKLKEIAIYLVNKREAIKKARLKYNMSGAMQALEHLFYEYLLKAFTKRQYVLNVPEFATWNELPELSAVSAGFRIVVEELYDDTIYLDKSPSLSAGIYYDLRNTQNLEFLSTYHFTSSDLEWLYKTGFYETCADQIFLWTEPTNTSAYPASAFTDLTRATLNEHTKFLVSEKYLGLDKYALSSVYAPIAVKTYSYDLIRGNTWFFWPSGEVLEETETVEYFPLPLSATELISNGATAGRKYQDADRIFVTRNGSISGAWLQLISGVPFVSSMRMIVSPESTYRFKFPYPGYGELGEALPWSGPTVSNADYQFDYLDQETKNTILSSYWNEVTAFYDMDPIKINQTSLVDDGAFASSEYGYADKVTVRSTAALDGVHDATPDLVYTGAFNRAWLYRMEKTALPIAVGRNYLYWPVERYNSSLLPSLVLSSDGCTPMALSSITDNGILLGARPGYDLFDSDILYKLNGQTGQPTECAFLSGMPLSNLTQTVRTAAITGVQQPGLTLKVKPNVPATFIWSDTDTKINTTSLHHYNHHSNCPYLDRVKSSIYGTVNQTLDETGFADIGIGGWRDCSCRAALYSPIGHPGAVFDEYARMADFVILDTQYPLPVDFTTWRGSDGKDYKTSQDFAWFKLTQNDVEVDVGQDIGQWVNYDGVSTGFTFKNGHQYKYFRTNLGRDEADLAENAVPYIVIKQQYQNPVTKWCKAVFDGVSWVSTENDTDMVLNPGDYLMYDHINSNWYCLTSNLSATTVVTTYLSTGGVGDSPWSHYTYTVTGSIISINWPTSYSSTLSAIAAELSSVMWVVKNPDQTYLLSGNSLGVDVTLNFKLDQAGIYSISAIGYYSTSGATDTYVLPAITAHPIYRTTGVEVRYTIDTVYEDTINFSICKSLSGWNYTTHSYVASSNEGSKPFWAVAQDDDSITTREKGVDVHGGIVRVLDDYTLITQPVIATFELNTRNYVEYERRAPVRLVWDQTMTLYDPSVVRQWSMLVPYPSAVTPLSSFVCSKTTDLVASALSIPSNIVFYPTNTFAADQTWVNYWAKAKFTWIQPLSSYNDSDSVNVSGLAVETRYPYANLFNMHYPTVATVPYVGGLYTQKDVGGYFTPNHVGVGVFIGKSYTNEIDTGSGTMTGVFVMSDPVYYRSDSGFMSADYLVPVSTIRTDALWMKAGVAEGYRRGMIVNARYYQKYTPYQTKFESTGISTQGLVRVEDATDPFTDSDEMTWQDTTNYPLDFRNIYNVYAWYDNQIPTDRQIYQWKTDIFGNQYALFKDTDGKSVYEKRLELGYIWTRDAKGFVSPATDSLAGLYTTLSTVSGSLYLEAISGIKDFDVWCDTLFVYTQNYIIFSKLDFNYDTNVIETPEGNIQYVQLGTDDHCIFGGTWYFEKEKTVTYCTLASAGSGVYYPQLWSYDVEDSVSYALYSGDVELSSTTEYLTSMASMYLTSIEDPLLTYDADNRIYNISFIGHSINKIGMNMVSMNIEDIGDSLVFDALKCIIPTR